MNAAFVSTEVAPLYGMQGLLPQPDEPPHSLEAEQSVLGGLMLDCAAWPAVEMLSTAHFFHSTHQSIFSAIGSLVAAGQPVDVITVFERLQRLGKADSTGGLPYLNSLTCSVPSAGSVRHYAEIVIERAALREQLAVADEMRSAAFHPLGRSALELVEAAQKRLERIAVHSGPRALPFKLVDLDQLGQVEPPAQQWFWGGLMPAGHVTLLNGHGGAGKSTLGLTLACCVSVGEPYLGRATRRARVLFFSGEDPAELVLRRVDRICRALNLDTYRVRERLTIVDATEFDPVLFFEQRSAERAGKTTPTYAALERLVGELRIEVLVVDNASDVFEGDEIKRSLVRAFMRSLAALVRPRGGAALLLAHVDKSTSRGQKGMQGSETYSGSTAWHNSARSRLFLAEQAEAGRFELQHQKSNLGPRQEPIELEQVDGLLRMIDAADGEPGGATAQAAVDANDTRALLRLIAEFNTREEVVSASPNSPQNNAAKLFAGEKTCPKRPSAEIFALLRDADRKGLATRIAYAGTDRKKRERWALTAAGRDFAGLPAASAASAATGSV